MFAFAELARQIREADNGGSLANLHDADSGGFLEALLRIAEDYERLANEPRPMLDIREFERLNLERSQAPNGFNHKLHDWSLSDWFTAMVGEFGEAGNVVKKLNRYRDGINGNTEAENELQKQLAREIADSFIYMVLFCLRAGIDLAKAVEETFNAKSEKIGWKPKAEPSNGLPYGQPYEVDLKTVQPMQASLKIVPGEPLSVGELVTQRPEKAVNLNDPVWVKFTPESERRLKAKHQKSYHGYFSVDLDKIYPKTGEFRKITVWQLIIELAPLLLGTRSGYHPIESGLVYFEKPS